ncbi:MAG TPA: SufD family Fe-S cluster assembly protein, partial [Gemmatimonadales bacterium]|nr:SufD family Fe-S cluster assembly protein [Gemmatimonadales bacterium]
ASHQARVDRDATLRHIVVSFGGSLARVNPTVELAGTGSRGELFGLSYSDAGQHLESQVYLHHKGADTKGDVLYKGALQGAGARSVWIGDVLIGPDATGTDSYEANRNLVLTDGARAESIPNLEIETGDIRGAGHASATGRFDDEQLFYLQARGIAEKEARRLVVIGFLSEIVQKIGDLGLQSRLNTNLAVAYCALTNRCEERGLSAAQTALDLDRQLGQLDHLAVPLIVLGQIQQCHGDPELARGYYQEALALVEPTGEPQFLFPCYDGLATLYLDRDDHVRAEEFMRKAQQVCEQAGLDPESFVVLPFLE